MLALHGTACTARAMYQSAALVCLTYDCAILWLKIAASLDLLMLTRENCNLSYISCKNMVYV